VVSYVLLRNYSLTHSSDSCFARNWYIWTGLYFFILICTLFMLCCYAVQLQIEEITRRLRSGELGIPANPGDR